MARVRDAAWRFFGVALVCSCALTACLQAGGNGQTVAMIPGYGGTGATTAVQPRGYPATNDVITAQLTDTSPQQMSIELSQSFAPAGKVSFLIANAGTVDHEMVVLRTDQPAASFPITGFEGESNRFNEDAKGLTNVGETGDSAMKPGTSKMLTIDMAPGHYAIVCNLNGHYAAGMHQDFWVTPPGATPITAQLTDTSPQQMSIELSQSFAPAGKVSFLIANAGTVDHEMVVLRTDQPAASFPITGFEGESNRFNEDAKGLTNVGETGDPAMKPGTSKMLTIDMAPGHYAIVCNLNGHYAAGMHQDFWVTPPGATPITAQLTDTSPQQMSIELSQSFAPAGKVSFLIANAGTVDHEMVVLRTDQPAASFPITGFEGESNRFNEDAKGLTNVGETGDPAMKPGTSKMLTIDMAPGHYAIVCNLNGHYAAGMHQDFWVTPPGATPITAQLTDTSPQQMSIELSQSFAPAGKVSFLIANAGTVDHEMVVLRTDQPAASFPITGFEGESNRFNEDAKGLTNVGETGDPAMKPGTSKMLTIDMAPGHYAIVCNLNGHYAAGMHQDFWVTPPGATPITAQLTDTSPQQMSIELSQSFAPAGKVSFLIANAGTVDHEMVVLRTDQPAASFPITGFEGESNRFNEDAKGLTNVGETGDPAMKPGTSKMLTIDMAPGHYAIVCNLNGHYAAGMHQDFWVTPPGATPITAQLTAARATRPGPRPISGRSPATSSR